MTRDQKIKIAMVICAVVLLCAVIITSTGLFSLAGISGYADAEKYTAGGTEITGEVKNLDINWTSGKVTVAYHAENTVTLTESAKRALSDDEQMRWWLDGDTLRVQFAKSGIRLNMPEKELTLTLPEGTELKEARIHTTSADMEIQALKAEENILLESTSGDIQANAEAWIIRTNSTSGNTKIRSTGKLGGVVVYTTSGAIDLEVEKCLEIETGSTSGQIRISAGEATNTATVQSTSGNIRISLTKMTKLLKINATSGDITAVLPEEPGFTASVDTTSGKFTYELALSKDGSNYVCGDGSAKVDIDSTSGNVRIEAVQ